MTVLKLSQLHYVTLMIVRLQENCEELQIKTALVIKWQMQFSIDKQKIYIHGKKQS